MAGGAGLVENLLTAEATVAESGGVNATIRFDRNNEIERAMPDLLSDHARMSVTAWTDFCDGVDADIKPFKRVKILSNVLWFVLVVLAATGWLWDGGRQALVYGTLVPIAAVVLWGSWGLEGYVAKKVGSKVSKRCASACNGVQGLSMTLHVEGEKPKEWHIEVKVRRSTGDVEHAAVGYAPAMATATATAVEPEIVVHAVAEPSAPPKY